MIFLCEINNYFLTYFNYITMSKVVYGSTSIKEGVHKQYMYVDTLDDDVATECMPVTEARYTISDAMEVHNN